MNNQTDWSTHNNHLAQDPYPTSVIAHTPRQDNNQYSSNDCINDQHVALFQQYQQQAWCQGLPIESAYHPYLSFCANWPSEVGIIIIWLN